MINVSEEYKKAMDKPIRDRAYISVGVGVINQDAQKSAIASGDFAYWCKGDVFKPTTQDVEYATLERNYMRADGKMYFVPESNLEQLKSNGIVTEEIMGSIMIVLQKSYYIKGITLEFGSAYPTRFNLVTNQGTVQYTNDSERFVTEDVFGDISYIQIVPLEMVGGNKRLRIKRILMGVGLQYTNEDTKTFSINEIVSSISDELSSYRCSFSFYDKEDKFDVDDNNSFIDYLETMQKITFSFGITLADGSIEWHQIATTYLKDWKRQNNVVTLTSYDRMYHMDNVYSLGNRIYERTAYDEAISIFKDAGLESDEYYVDEYLKEFNLINPMPEASHKQCLQILANACRCKIKQDEYGVVMVVPNFAVLIDREETKLSSTPIAEWGNLENIFIGSDIVYAELTPDFMKADGSMRFMPENEEYLNAGFVSNEISDQNGEFLFNPSIGIDLEYANTYHGLVLEFGGNMPKQFVVETFNDNEIVKKIVVDNVEKTTIISEQFDDFDRMYIRFTKASPNSRVIVNKVSFGGLSDYFLKRNNMYQNPVGYKEKRVKDVRVKIYSFFENAEGEPEEIEDEVYYSRQINPVGESKLLSNPLIATEEHAAIIAEWIGNYYANNVTYDVNFRGEPRLNATDIIRMESSKIPNLQVEVTSNELTFNGAFRGNLGLRRAYNMTKGAI